MRKYVFAVAAMVLVGVGVSFYLIPSQEEVKVLKARDAARVRTPVNYRELYEAGDRSEMVLVGLADQLLAADDIASESITALQSELEKFVATNAQTVQARKRLADIYRRKDQDENYLEQAEKIAQLDPSEANLLILADAYNYTLQYDKQAEILRQLMTLSNGDNPKYYADLAMILTLEDRRGEANGVIDALKARHPDYTSYKVAYVVTSGYVDSGNMEPAYREAASWVNLKPEAAEIAALADLLTYGGRPDLALALIAPQATIVTTHPSLLLSYTNAAINADESDKAYALLRDLDATDTLPALLYPSLYDIAFMRGDIDYAHATTARLNRRLFDQESAANLLEIAQQHRQDEILAQLLVLFDEPQYLADKPVLSAIIALHQPTANEAAKEAVLLTALESELTAPLRLRLAQACARFGREECFDTVVSMYPPLRQMSPREIDEITRLYILARRSEEIRTDIYALADANNVEKIRHAAIRIAAASGDIDIVSEWLARAGRTAPSRFLTEIFFLANDRGYSDSAADIAELLYDRTPSDRHRDYLVSAYVASGQDAKALPLLRQAKDNNQTSADLYLAALINLADGDAVYSEELKAFVLPQLKDAEINAERKLQLVYTLINTGNRKAALTFIDQYAKSEGGQWRTLHHQIYARSSSGKTSAPAEILVTERPRAFRVALAMKPETAAQTRRMLAFSLLNDGHRDDAVAVFFDMAKDAPPTSQEVKDVLYLWGPRLNEQQIAWIMRRARNAQSASEVIAWADILQRSSDPYALMAFVTEFPATLENGPIRRAYLNALATYGDAQTFTAGMQKWRMATDNLAALHDYANVAQAHSYPDAALQTYQRIHQLAPQDEKALQQLAIMAYGNANYSEARQYINDYLVQQQSASTPQTSPYEMLFYKASLLRRDKKDDEAMAYYRQITEMGPQEATSLNRQTIYYTSMYYLGYRDQARRGFYGLLNAYPDSKNLLADFLSVLVDGGQIEEAELVANQYDPASPLHGQLAGSMSLPAQNVTAIEPFQNGQQMRMQFDRPVDPDMLSDIDQPGWIEGMQRGYDSIVISARPGYEMRFTPASASHVAFVASTAPAISPAEQRQARLEDLRLQLLYARMELESGQQGRALARVRELKQYFPAEPQLISYQASLENSAGNWPRALALLQEAQEMTPQNEDIMALRRNIEREYGSEIKFDHTWRRIGNSDEQISTVAARLKPTPTSEIGAIFQNNEIDASQIRRAEGGRIGNYQMSRQRGEIYGAHYFSNGDKLKAALFANTDTVGAGGYYAFSNPAGRTELIGEYKRPYWDFVEAVVENTTRSRVGAKHIANLNSRTTVSGEVSYNIYDIETTDNAAETALVRANIVHRIRDANPTVAVGYGFDGEYMLDDETATDPQGNEYRLFPIVSREIHYPNVIVSQQWDETYGEVVAGYAVDRLGDHGPQLSARVNHEVTGDVDAELRASYGLQTNDSEQNVTHVGGHLRYKF